MTNPLFISSMTDLKARLRLTSAQADALNMLDSAVLQVRIGFYERLGTTRVAQLLSYTASENPTTTQEMERALANNCEENWARLLLMRRMPVLFVSAVPAAPEIWNQEALTREAHGTGLERELSRLGDEVESALAKLTGESTTQTGDINVTCLEPDTIPDLPGESIYPDEDEV